MEEKKNFENLECRFPDTIENLYVFIFWGWGYKCIIDLVISWWFIVLLPTDNEGGELSCVLSIMPLKLVHNFKVFRHLLKSKVLQVSSLKLSGCAFLFQFHSFSRAVTVKITFKKITIFTILHCIKNVFDFFIFEEEFENTKGR